MLISVLFDATYMKVSRFNVIIKNLFVLVTFKAESQRVVNIIE